jgi:hypothetical protein
MERNLAIITGLLISKKRNANNKDIKRPILDFEVIFAEGNGRLTFEKIPVLLPGGAIARAAAGCMEGIIYIVCGELKTVGGQLCIEAKRIAPVGEEKRKQKACSMEQALTLGRADLMRLTLAPNMVSFQGRIKELQEDTAVIVVKREVLTPGDLTKEDLICVYLPEDADSKPGDLVLCHGQVTEREVVLGSILTLQEDM